MVKLVDMQLFKPLTLRRNMKILIKDYREGNDEAVTKSLITHPTETIELIKMKLNALDAELYKLMFDGRELLNEQTI